MTLLRLFLISRRFSSLGNLLVLLQNREYLAHLVTHMLDKGHTLRHLMQLLVESTLRRRVEDHDKLSDSHPVYMDRALEHREVKGWIVPSLVLVCDVQLWS